MGTADFGILKRLLFILEACSQPVGPFAPKIAFEFLLADASKERAIVWHEEFSLTRNSPRCSAKSMSIRRATILREFIVGGTPRSVRFSKKLGVDGCFIPVLSSSLLLFELLGRSYALPDRKSYYPGPRILLLENINFF
jgi:hypothetical protein